MRVLLLGANGQPGSDIVRLWDDPILSARDQGGMSLAQYRQKPAFQ